MALFTFISLVSSSQVVTENRELQKLPPQLSHNLDKQEKMLPLKMKKVPIYSNNFECNSSHQKLLMATESIYRFSNSYNDKPGLIHDLINKYWQQTIFLSVSNPVSKEYINQITKQDSLLTKQLRKKLLIAFSNALLDGRIDSSTLIQPNSVASLPLTCVKYQWKKGFNLVPSLNLLKNLKISDHAHFPNKTQQKLIQKFKNNNIPLFVVTNCFKQIIISEPSNKILNQRNLKNNLLHWYTDRVLQAQKNQGLYESWFFVNPQDADEYKNYIVSQYNRSSKQHKLTTTSSNLDFYYRLNRDAPAKMEFRLFPDLQEVGKLLKDYKNTKNIFFDKRQNYGKSYFQGQPLYFIEPVIGSKKNKKEKFSIDYFYNIPSDTSLTKYTAVFFSKDSALQGWKYFRKQMKEYNLPLQPNLRVYNLEDFLKDLEVSKDKDSNILFVPSLESYKHIEQQHIKTKGKTNLVMLRECTTTSISTSQLWLKRIILSLTSRQPPTW